MGHCAQYREHYWYIQYIINVKQTKGSFDIVQIDNK